MYPLLAGLISTSLWFWERCQFNGTQLSYRESDNDDHKMKSKMCPMPDLPKAWTWMDVISFYGHWSVIVIVILIVQRNLKVNQMCPMLRRKHEHEWSWKPPISFHGHQMVPNCLVTVHPAQSKPRQVTSSLKCIFEMCSDTLVHWWNDAQWKVHNTCYRMEQYTVQRGNTICHASDSKAFQSTGQEYLKSNTKIPKSAAEVHSY